ncbi:MAG: hypothetical protein B5M53_03865 [Candidatus Cloacimonas sp. 4484_209]|nr:MAG: hypothetical protein B5M53_03865 [Candidatus Cloacimonas sp. 4484_209]
MKAKVEIQNVGGIRGRIAFELERGKVNEVVAPNATGKTSLVRGLSAVLSAPFRDEFIINEAINLGIKGERGSKWEEIVNIYEDFAKISVTLDSDVKEYKVHKDGTVKKAPFGDERFLLAGLLTGECKTIRQLLTGNDKFDWIVNKLSRANFYERFYRDVKEERKTIESRKGEVERKIQEIAEKLKEKEQLEKQRDTVSMSLEEIKKRLDIEKQKLLEKRKNLNIKINKLKEEIEIRKGELRRKMKEKEELERGMKKDKETIKKLDKEIASIAIDKIRRDVEKKRNELDNKINELKNQRDEYRGNVNLFQEVLLEMKRGKKEESLCPVCHKSKITFKEVKATVSEYEEKVRIINSQIKKLNIEKEKENQKIVEEERKKAARERERTERLKSIKYKESRLKMINTEIPQITMDISKKSENINKMIEELKVLETKTKDEDEALNNEIKQLEQTLNDISEKIGNIKGFVEEYKKEKVGSVWIDPSVAEKIYSKWLTFLDALMNYLREMIHEHRERARTRFNQQIKELMDILEFTEFDQVALTADDYRLVVFRKGFVNQPIRTLSMSEKYAIATLLQITLKETYLPDIPFFVIDEVILSFDENRKRKIFAYLNEQAKQNNWFVIVTRLSEDVNKILVKPLEIK